MDLKKRLRPTMINTNARFRGPTESLKFVNMINETVHDLVLLGRVLDEDEGFNGQSTYIRNNFASYVNGDDVTALSNISSNSLLYAKKGPLQKNQADVENLTPWSTRGGCTKTENAGVYTLAVDGTAKPSGIWTDVEVDAGDIILMRFGVTHNSYTTNPLNTIKIGSENVNKNNGSFYEYALPQDDSIGYIDHIIECLYRETITLEIDVLHLDSTLSAGEIGVAYPEVCVIKRGEVNLLPVNLDIKSRINNLQAEIKNLS